jgi:hypothetical protein
MATFLVEQLDRKLWETGSSVSWLKGSDIGTPAIDG